MKRSIFFSLTTTSSHQLVERGKCSKLVRHAKTQYLQGTLVGHNSHVHWHTPTVFTFSGSPGTTLWLFQQEFKFLIILWGTACTQTLILEHKYSACDIVWYTITHQYFNILQVILHFLEVSTTLWLPQQKVWAHDHPTMYSMQSNINTVAEVQCMWHSLVKHNAPVLWHTANVSTFSSSPNYFVIDSAKFLSTWSFHDLQHAVEGGLCLSWDKVPLCPKISWGAITLSLNN